MSAASDEHRVLFNLDHGKDFSTTVAGVPVKYADRRARARLCGCQLSHSGAGERRAIQERTNSPSSLRATGFLLRNSLNLFSNFTYFNLLDAEVSDIDYFYIEIARRARGRRRRHPRIRLSPVQLALVSSSRSKRNQIRASTVAALPPAAYRHICGFTQPEICPARYRPPEPTRATSLHLRNSLKGPQVRPAFPVELWPPRDPAW